MKKFQHLVLLEVKKINRNVKFLSLPIIFCFLSFTILHLLLPESLESTKSLRVFLFLFISLSLKLSFGSIIQNEAKIGILQILTLKNYPLNTFILLKISLITIIFSFSFMLITGTIFLKNIQFLDLVIFPIFITILLLLQTMVEILTIKSKLAQYLCYLLLLPLEIPLFIFMIERNFINGWQIIKIMMGVLVLGISLLCLMSRLVLKKL